MVKAGALILDVRTEEEFAQKHLDGARNIPVQQLVQRLSEVGPPTTPVVVHCLSGKRSAAAAELLRKAGFKEVFDLGGISNW